MYVCCDVFKDVRVCVSVSVINGVVASFVAVVRVIAAVALGVAALASDAFGLLRPVRLETRTKTINTSASVWMFKPASALKSKRASQTGDKYSRFELFGNRR